MARGIQLTPAFASFSLGPTAGSRVTITATAAVDMSTAIFAYLLGPAPPGGGPATATFSHVCSPADLAEYPEGSPAEGACPAWFRLAEVDLVFRSSAQARAAYDAIYAQASVLAATLDRLDQLAAAAPQWAGTAP